MIMNCQYCSYQHLRGKCPAYKKICKACKGQGHFAKCCRKTKNQTTANINELKTDSSSTDSGDDFFIHTVVKNLLETVPSYDNDKPTMETDFPNESMNTNIEEDTEIKVVTLIDNWTIQLMTNGTNIYKIDTGADANVIPYEEYKKLKEKPKLIPSNAKLSAYNGSSIPVTGKCVLNIINKENKKIPMDECPRGFVPHFWYHVIKISNHQVM